MFSNHRAFIDIQKATFLHSVPPLLHVQVSEGRGGSLLACPERGRPGLFDPTASIHEPCGHAQCILQSAGYHAALIVLSLDLGKHTMPVRPVVTQGP